MNRHFPGLIFILACIGGCNGGGEIPTVEVGGPNGARVMNGESKTPAEAYENAYAQLTRAHYNVRRNLDSRGQNQLGAKEAMAQIVRSLETMKACVAADAAAFDPYLTRYGDWQKDLAAGSWGGAFLTDFERAERDVKAKFNPASVQILAAFPGAPKPEPSKPAEPPLRSDKVEVPVLAKTPVEAPRTTSPDTNQAATQRLLYRVWDRAHDDLVAAYQDQKDCSVKYADVAAALRLLKNQHTGEKATTLQIYVEYYGDVDEKTKTFTVLPEKTTRKDIIDELDVAARVIRKKFKPE